MKPSRSVLFVPGHKRDWIDKAIASGADAIIIDLEDSVPEESKQLARDNARDAIGVHRDGSTAVWVRPNALDTVHFAADVLAVSVDGLEALLLPKLFGRDDVVRFDALVTAAEVTNGVERGSISLVPSLETAASIDKVEEILHAPRVAGVMAAAAKDADVSREVGFVWSAGGIETLYLRSRIVVAARAAGLRVIVLGLWQEVHNIDGLREFATANRALGFTGQVLIHPSHAAVSNEVYGVSAAQRSYYERLISAFEAAQRAGNGAVDFEGEHVDLAHANHARAVLAVAAD